MIDNKYQCPTEKGNWEECKNDFKNIKNNGKMINVNFERIETNDHEHCRIPSQIKDREIDTCIYLDGKMQCQIKQGTWKSCKTKVILYLTLNM